MLYDIGRVCVKIAGRDAGKKCIIIDQLDDKYVLIDGQTRRRKCNISHLEPTKLFLKITKNADREKVLLACKDAGIVVEKKGAAKKTPIRPKKSHFVRPKK